MNRDEARTRADGEPPFQWATPRMLAPRDRNAGGTWMGVREDGAWACLLNGYVSHDQSPSSGPMQTRGRLVPMVLGSVDPTADLQADDLKNTDSFRLWVGTSTGGIQEWFWDRQQLHSRRLSEAEWYFVTSSSVDQSEVTEVRRGVFDQWRRDGAPHDRHGLPTVHCERLGLEPDQAILMDRPYAYTQSCTQIISRASGTHMRYWRRPTMGGPPDASLVMAPS